MPSRRDLVRMTDEEIDAFLHERQSMGVATFNHDQTIHLVAMWYGFYEGKPAFETFTKSQKILNLRRDETAVLCLLMLRGPQTPGELRSRADRLYTFDDLAAVQSTLERLAARTTSDEAGNQTTRPLITVLPRQPGSREARYAHLLGAPPDLSLTRQDRSEPGASTPSSIQRIIQLEAEVATLIAAVQTLKDRVDRLESGA